MISLKKYLDELAGPDHPFSKGVPVEGLALAAEKNGSETVDEKMYQALNRFLRVNKN